MSRRRLAGVGAALTCTAAATALAWLRTHLLTVHVEGISMRPAFNDGDLLLARRHGRRPLLRGDVVVVTSPWQPAAATAATTAPALLVKRVAALPGDPVPADVPADTATVGPGRLAVLGDSVGYDSTTFGLLRLADVRGVVVRRVHAAPPLVEAVVDAGYGPGVSTTTSSALVADQVFKGRGPGGEMTRDFRRRAIGAALGDD